MGEQILVSIELPAAERVYEVLIPSNIRISEMQSVIADLLASLSDGMFLPVEPIVLINKSNGKTLNINATPAEQRIQHGSQLLLI